MLNSIQSFIDSEIIKVTDINKSWIDAFKPNEEGLENQVITQLSDRKDFKDNCNSGYSEFTFKIFILGSGKRNSTRILSEELYTTFSNINGISYEQIEIIFTNTTDHSFEFLEEKKNSVNKFNLKIVASPQ